MKPINPETISFYNMMPYLFFNYFSGPFDQQATNMALPAIQKELGLGVALSQWFSTITTITKASFAIPMANLGVLIGVELAFYLGSLLIAICNTSMYFAKELISLLAIRFFVGIGQQIALQASQAQVQNLLKQQNRTNFLRYQGLFMQAIGVFGPLICTQVIDSIGWRWNYIICAVIMIFRILYTLILIEKVQIQGQKFDILSCFLLVFTLTGICISFTALAYYKYIWFSVLLCLSLTIGFLFVLNENKSRHPLIDKFVLQKPVLNMVCVISFLFSMGQCESIIAPQYFNAVFNNTTTIGYINSVKFFISFVSACIVTGVVKKHQEKSLIIVIIGTLIGLALTLLQCVFAYNIIAYSVFYSIKQVFLAPIQVVIRPFLIGSVSKQLVHHVTGFQTTLMMILSCMGQTLVGMILQMMLKATGNNYGVSMSVCYIAFIIILVVILVIVIRLKKYNIFAPSRVASDAVEEMAVKDVENATLIGKQEL